VAGKGDKRIPAQVSSKQVSDNWDRIFGKREEEKVVRPESSNNKFTDNEAEAIRAEVDVDRGERP
tara:strand:- start:150 stop:344 length:195 start_codon:yes stop_codon:yes gene_type:complete